MKKRVFLDGIHTAVIDINETNKTAIAELEKNGESELVYAEKFDKVCNYEKEAIKAVVAYLKSSINVTAIKSVASGVAATMLLAICINIK